MSACRCRLLDLDRQMSAGGSAPLLDRLHTGSGGHLRVYRAARCSRRHLCVCTTRGEEAGRQEGPAAAGGGARRLPQTRTSQATSALGSR